MPSYHSGTSAENCKFIGNFPLLPLKSTTKFTARGIAPVCNEEFDIVDEGLNLFKVSSILKLLLKIFYTVWSEGVLYKVAPPELNISPIMYFVMYNSIVKAKVPKIIVPIKQNFKRVKMAQQFSIFWITPLNCGWQNT